MLRPQGLAHLPFSALYGFDTLKLAHVLDSLVRVSRRVEQDRYVWYCSTRNQPASPQPDKGSHPEDHALTPDNDNTDIKPQANTNPQQSASQIQ